MKVFDLFDKATNTLPYYIITPRESHARCPSARPANGRAGDTGAPPPNRDRRTRPPYGSEAALQDVNRFPHARGGGTPTASKQSESGLQRMRKRPPEDLVRPFRGAVRAFLGNRAGQIKILNKSVRNTMGSPGRLHGYDLISYQNEKKRKSSRRNENFTRNRTQYILLQTHATAKSAMRSTLRPNITARNTKKRRITTMISGIKFVNLPHKYS